MLKEGEAMAERRTFWLAAGFAAGLLLTGVPYWRLPYNADYLADTALLLGFAGLGVVAAMLAVSGAAQLGQLFWAMLAAFPVAVIIRVVIDTMEDPTDHNLWPFEVVFAGVVSLAAVVPGLLVGGLVRRIRA
jgi:peptidoglycan/LPS O-acetylase OafA/YrhL